jgi:hypothetical protein
MYFLNNIMKAIVEVRNRQAMKAKLTLTPIIASL